MPLWFVGLIAAAVLVVDQASKSWAVANLTDGPVHLVGSLQFRLTYNTGASFSLGDGRNLGPWIAVLALVCVVFLLRSDLGRGSWLGAVTAGLVAGGALGNLADRAFRGDAGFLHGGVVDFIDLQWWPVFNVADAAIVVGGILLVVVALRAPASEPSES